MLIRDLVHHQLSWYGFLVCPHLLHKWYLQEIITHVFISIDSESFIYTTNVTVGIHLPTGSLNSHIDSPSYETKNIYNNYKWNHNPVGLGFQHPPP